MNYPTPAEGSHISECEDYNLVFKPDRKETIHDRFNLMREILELLDDGTHGFHVAESNRLQTITRDLDALHHDFTERTQSTHD